MLSYHLAFSYLFVSIFFYRHFVLIFQLASSFLSILLLIFILFIFFMLCVTSWFFFIMDYCFMFPILSLIIFSIFIRLLLNDSSGPWILLHGVGGIQCVIWWTVLVFLGRLPDAAQELTLPWGYLRITLIANTKWRKREKNLRPRLDCFWWFLGAGNTTLRQVVFGITNWALSFIRC